MTLCNASGLCVDQNHEFSAMKPEVRTYTMSIASPNMQWTGREAQSSVSLSSAAKPILNLVYATESWARVHARVTPSC